MKLSPLFAIFFTLGCLAGVGGGLRGEEPAPAPALVTAPPPTEVERLGLTPFYRKYTQVQGFPIVSSERVADPALREAAHLIGVLLEGKPAVAEALVTAKIRFAIMAKDEFTTTIPEHSHLRPRHYWDRRARGLGSSLEHPAVSCGEENLLDYPGDPYSTENILIHEFAHTLHLQGLAKADPSFDGRLKQAYEAALAKGLWKGKYAGTNKEEYWAEAVQSWFDCNRENDYEHNHVNTRAELVAYDPALAALVKEVFGDGAWRYRKPRERSGDAHLAGYDAGKAPRFAWPQELTEAYEAWRRGDHLVKLQPLPAASPDEGLASPASDKRVMLRIDNQLPGTVSIYWIGFDGQPKSYGRADPTRSFTQDTFAGHLWLVKDEKDQPVALYRVGEAACQAIVRAPQAKSQGG